RSCSYTLSLHDALPISTAESSASSAEGYRIAIVQQMDHASLDQIRAAIEAELDAKAAEQGIAIEYELFNGQNDATTLNQIGTQVDRKSTRLNSSHVSIS